MTSNIVISLDERHHIKGDQPLYKNRFDSVQSFHFPPGYAPVKKQERAFFINTSGEQVFRRIFLNAFGFYSGIATVEDSSGFFHINEDGETLYDERFAWAGNFQEQACIVESAENNRFFHVNKQGQALYAERYRYAGDYRYGVAVVTMETGLCTHIDSKGKHLHGNFFLELDVYHKGYAIAKDEKGYFHINKYGQAQYSKRYEKLEPFYNGRSLASDTVGNKLLISNDANQQVIYQK